MALVQPWYETKLFIEHALSIEHGTLHVVVGMLCWLGLAMIFRHPLTSWRPWLGLFVLIVWNEFVDLRIERWPHPGMQLGETAQDLFLTMLVPTLILVVARLWPDLFAPPPAPAADMRTADDRPSDPDDAAVSALAGNEMDTSA